MKYGFSRSLNCNSDTDRRNSSVIARDIGSPDVEESWLRETNETPSSSDTKIAHRKRVEGISYRPPLVASGGGRIGGRSDDFAFFWTSIWVVRIAGDTAATGT